MFKPIVVSENQFRAEQSEIAESDVKRVFMVLHGFYGNLFFSKYSTGTVENGEDMGIANTRKIWAHGLREYDAQTIKTALRHCQTKHVEFPPSLPQFVALCAAAKPRVPFNAGPKAIEMGQELRSKYAAGAREINARHAEKKAHVATGYFPIAEGLAGLKQAIADAFGCAGGSEAAMLVKLDRMYPVAA